MANISGVVMKVICRIFGFIHQVAYKVMENITKA